MLSTAFLAPATAAPATSPVLLATPSVVAYEAAPITASALGGASKAAGACALASALVAARAVRRQLRSARKAGGAAVAEAGVPPPPPPFQPGEQIGSMAPLGFFDPLGFTMVGDEEGFKKLRASELKHGRVAMMASVGLLGQHFIRLPGCEKAPAGLAAMGSGEGILGFTALFVVTAFLELAWREEAGREAGNFGDPFGVKMYSEEMRSKEISNGRFAMICVMGIFAAELATGKDAIQQFGF